MKPIYSIDAPDQQRLKTARIEIEAILMKHDLAGVVILHTPGMSEFFYDIRPTYSVCWIDEKEGSFHIKSKKDEDHNGSPELQQHDQRATANMAAAMADNLQAACNMFLYAKWFVDDAFEAEHGKARFTVDPREANPS